MPDDLGAKQSELCIRLYIEFRATLDATPIEGHFMPYYWQNLPNSLDFIWMPYAQMLDEYSRRCPSSGSSPRWRGHCCARVSTPIRSWRLASASSASGATPTRVGTSLSPSPAVWPPHHPLSAPLCSPPTLRGGSCVAVSFIRTPPPDRWRERQPIKVDAPQFPAFSLILAVSPFTSIVVPKGRDKSAILSRI
jgi:hypothetical protein